MKIKASKRYKKLLDSNKDKKIETIDEAIIKVKKNCTSKFDESIDVSFSLNLKKKKEELTLRTIVNLPNGNGKKVKVATLCEEGKIQEAKDSGADVFGSDICTCRRRPTFASHCLLVSVGRCSLAAIGTSTKNVLN